MNREEITPDSGPSPEQFAAFLDGELEADARTRIEDWLAKHPAVAEAIEGQRKLMGLWQVSITADPTPIAWAAVYDRIEAKLRPISRRPRATRRTLWLSAGVAAAVLTAVLLTRQFQSGGSANKPPVITSGIITETDQEPILLASQDDVSVVNVESYWQDDGRVPSIGEGNVSMIVAAPLAADREP